MNLSILNKNVFNYNYYSKKKIKNSIINQVTKTFQKTRKNLEMRNKYIYICIYIYLNINTFTYLAKKSCANLIYLLN